MLKDLHPSTTFVSFPAIYGEGSVQIQAVWTDGHLITDDTGTQQLLCTGIKICIPGSALLHFLHYSYHARRELRKLAASPGAELRTPIGGQLLSQDSLSGAPTQTVSHLPISPTSVDRCAQERDTVCESQNSSAKENRSTAEDWNQWQIEFRGQIRALRHWLKDMEMRLPIVDPGSHFLSSGQSCCLSPEDLGDHQGP
ncbi:hypothetical protein SKAU_G00215610 [Synaphobranchus kaupii]|uniref:Uncharacterized protein n=1 Tax=Synaphobranchus kaupii TaxID=118154 RepID=A0A9Q1F9N1_SYNKA|nr:hypothetical protein SKAU_G00215610 [Synaphobranchus kaupii]